MALDFVHDTKYAQPLIEKKMHEVQDPPIQDTNQPKLSIADELSKLAKLKEQGVITEEIPETQGKHVIKDLIHICSLAKYYISILMM